MKNKDKRNFIWNFLGVSINSFNSLLFLIIVNRINGSNDAGIFTYAYSLISLLFFIGVYYGRTYQIADKTNNYTNLDYIFNRIITCMIMLVVSILYVKIMNYDSYKSTIIMLLCGFRLLEAFADIFYGILQQHNELYKAGFSTFIKGVLGVIFFFITDYYTHSLEIACLTLIIVNLLMIILFDYKESIKYIGNDIHFGKSFGLFKVGFPVFIYSFLNIYLVNSSKYFLDYFGSADLQNIYGIILMPGTILSLCCQYLLNPYISRLSNYYIKKDYGDFNKIILFVVKCIIAIGIFGEIGCYLVGIPILNFIYKINLINYKWELMIIIFGAIFMGLCSVISSALTIIQKNKIQMYIFMFDSFLSTLLSFFLIKQSSIFGASLSYLIIMLIQFINCFAFYRYYISGWRKKNERKN